MPAPAPDPSAIAWLVNSQMVHAQPNCADSLPHVYRCRVCGCTTDHRFPSCHRCNAPDPNSWVPVHSGDVRLSPQRCAACGTDIAGLLIIDYSQRMGKSFRFSFNEHRTYGIEIECVINSDSSRDTIREEIISAGIAVFDNMSYSHTHAGNRSWIMKTDGSIRGPNMIEGWQSLEIVSPVLCGSAAFEEVKTVCEILRRHCTVNSSCGLHIHQGATDLSGLDMVKLYQQCFTDQGIYQYLLPAHRRNNHYCAPLRRCTNPNQIATLHSWGGVSSAPSQVANHLAMISGRASVNYNSYAIRGTIEFRMHSGTLSWEKIRNWVVFTQSLLEKARCTAQSFYRRYTDQPTSTIQALSFLLFSRLGYSRDSRKLEGLVASQLIRRHRELVAGVNE